MFGLPGCALHAPAAPRAACPAGARSAPRPPAAACSFPAIVNDRPRHDRPPFQRPIAL